jgi:Eco57I restriction-modification methylase
MNEWEFTVLVAGWINEILGADHTLPFSEARCEQRTRRSLKRRDITLLDRNNQIVLTGEVKLPYMKDGSTPFNEKLCRDARSKAQKAKSPFFFTWNVNECVLWETETSEATWREESYRSWDVTRVTDPKHLPLPPTESAIRKWLHTFLHDFARALDGTSPLPLKPLDERFVETLESALQMPIHLTFDALWTRYTQARFKGELDRWMRELGWIIRDDEEGIRDNLERAAKIACYGMVNKLVFYEALSRRFSKYLKKLRVPAHITTGDALRNHLFGEFEIAKDRTGDYETVFGLDHRLFEHRIPFYDDRTTVHWRELVERIHEFDFGSLDYDVIGNIFEKFISPEERHKFGQYFTRVEVVDLINSFCIRRGDEKIMDPACGGGTFLVRAYVRKRDLMPTRNHTQMLDDIHGIDISGHAAHLTTINLATRDLVDAENYPRVARDDFFNIRPKHHFLSLPRHLKTKGLGKIQQREITIPELDAIVGNPPYLRQEEIQKGSKKKSHPGTKEFYQNLIKEETGLTLSGRSDIHCYFWPHASCFLKENGLLCLLTSSQWLDVEYGFRLQEWILKNFRVIACFESLDEPWFVGARVATVATILQREPNEQKRMGNEVRFVQLRRALREILAHDDTTSGAMLAADGFRDEILNLPNNTVNNRYRARLVSQGAIWRNGVELGALMRKTHTAQAGDEQSSRYYGGKWGVYLRAPDLWFRLLDEYGDGFVPLGEIAHIWRGVTSGKDAFFFPIDCSQDTLQRVKKPKEFHSEYGVPRKDVESGRVKLVKCGEGRGEVRPIESRFLEPEVHSLMEVNSYVVKKEDCTRMILLVGEPREKLKNTYVLRYIQWGEKRGYQNGSTCAARVTKDREWYDLTGHRRGQLFWPMAQQYKHVIALNEEDLICNHNLFDVSSKDKINVYSLWGVLNSTIVALSKFQFGRPVGVEGNLKTEVIDVNMMLVPDPRRATKAIRTKLARIYEEIKERSALQFISERRLRTKAYTRAGKEDALLDLPDVCELDMNDRRKLDDAVLQILGVKPKSHRDAILDELYAYMREFFEYTREKEEKAIENKKRAKKKGPARAWEIAQQIHDELVIEYPGFQKRYDADFLNTDKDYTTFDLPSEGSAIPLQDMIHRHPVEFIKGKKHRVDILETDSAEQCELVCFLAKQGLRGLVRIPHEEKECRRVYSEYEHFVRQRNERVRKMIEERSSDEDMQEKIYKSLVSQLLY